MVEPDQTNAEVSDERLREIIDGCEGVQGGPWQLDAFACYVWAPSEKGGDFPLMDELGEKGRVAELRGWGYYTGNGHGALGLDPDEARRRQKLTGEHVARLDPDTVKALATELLNRRSVTSQASEGAQAVAFVPQLVLDALASGNERINCWLNAKARGDWTPLYAAPVSKRVERLETALTLAHEEIVLVIAFLGRDIGTARERSTIDGLSNRLVDADAAIRQALQGGRS